MTWAARERRHRDAIAAGKKPWWSGQVGCDCIDCDGTWCTWCLDHHGRRPCPVEEECKAPRDLWQRLSAKPPAEELHERAAQWLWLQARAPSGVPVFWNGWRLESANGKKPTDRAEDLRWPGQAQRDAWRMGEEVKKPATGGAFLDRPP